VNSEGDLKAPGPDCLPLELVLILCKYRAAFPPKYLQFANRELTTISLKPTKVNIAVKLVVLVWAPYWRDPAGQKVPAWE